MQPPIIKLIHVCPPIVVQTDPTNFPLVVQELTGKRKTPTSDTQSNDNGITCSFGCKICCKLARQLVDTQEDDIAERLQDESSTLKISAQSTAKDHQASPRESYTGCTSCCDDMQQEITSWLQQDENHAFLRESTKSIPEMDLLASEIFSQETTLPVGLAPTPPWSPPRSSFAAHNPADLFDDTTASSSSDNLCVLSIRKGYY